MVSVPDAWLHVPLVVACGSHRVQSPQLESVLYRVPVKPVLHVQRVAWTVELLLAGQLLQVLGTFDATKVPAPHAVQAWALVAPVLGWTVPAVQFWQSVWRGIPLPVWYVPTEHWAQAEATAIPVPVWYVPGSQALQSAWRDIPVPVWYVPAAHSLQLDRACIPVPVWYVPLGQDEGVETAAKQYLPAGQTVPAETPAAQYEPAGQLVPAETPAAQYEPAGQGEALARPPGQ